MIHYLHHT